MKSLPKEEFQSDELSLKQAIIKLQHWAKYLLSKWLIIIIAAGIGGVYGLYGEYSKKPVYKARISFVIENANSGAAGAGEMGGFASQFGLDIGSSATGATFSAGNLQELMVSRTMIQKALLSPVKVNGKVQSLGDFYIDIKGYRKQWAGSPLKDLHFLPHSNPDLFTLEQNSVMNNIHSSIIKNDLIVNMKKGLGLATIEVSSENELFSKYFSEVLLRVVSDFYILTKTKKSHQNFMILKTQVDSMKRVLNIAVSGVAASVDANPNANRARTVLGVNSQRRQIDVQANQAFYVQLIQNLESAKISLRKETPLIQVIDAPVLPLEVSDSNRKSALLYGGFIGAFIAIAFLVIRKLLKEILNS